MAWHARCVGRRRDSGAADAGPRDVGPLGRRLTLTLDPTIDGESEDPPKATSITSADLLDPNGVVLAAASILDGAAVFDLAHVVAGDYSLRLNGDGDDLVPTRIDVGTSDLSHIVDPTQS